MYNLPETFGCNVFNDATMKAKLPKDTYKALKQSVSSTKPLPLEVANVVASAMKDWALEKGVTHFTHWFQPMTGITAEKHDSFINFDGEGGAIMEFSGKALVQGEPDASSFPNGGLRATFEARGYTAWDPTSPAFIKSGVLCIPTAFCSYNGEALDKKTPLLRSMEALEKQAIRILRLFGDEESKKVIAQVGPEQEYFLIDKEVYKQRPDLMYTGRTLIGARPSKGQELDNHYFGSIKSRVHAFMKELDEELWKLGVYAKTEHNEVAPAQHELAPIFSTANVATDANQITMELMQSLAPKHDLVCLLHEKPFSGLNGSGKHNNWSMSTEHGDNLLEPGETPIENARFLLVLCSIIKAVDDYQEILRLSVATAGNDHRLGANEAPPAVISMFLGDELTAILESIEKDTLYVEQEKTLMQIGVNALPRFQRDTTDRNRTSPFAFTGNKFEFRMPGSTVSISNPNIVLNTIVAETFEKFADELEKVDAASFNDELENLIRKTLKDHNRIIFNGNGYDPAWLEEAASRGLANLKNTPEALPEFVADKSIDLFTRHGVFTEAEIRSRCEILLENYSNTINIEALTMIDMVNKDIIPSVLAYQTSLAETIIVKKDALGDACPCALETSFLEKVSALSDSIVKSLATLEDATSEVKRIEDVQEQATAYREKVFTAMGELRGYVDQLELIVSSDYWPFPTYAELLYSVSE